MFDLHIFSHTTRQFFLANFSSYYNIRILCTHNSEKNYILSNVFVNIVKSRCFKQMACFIAIATFKNNYEHFQLYLFLTFQDYP